MKGFKRLALPVWALPLLLLGASDVLSAESDVNQFFEKDSVLDVFGPPVVEKTAVEFQHLPPKRMGKIEVITKEDVSFAEEAPEASAKPKHAKQFKTKEDVLAEFGNPEEALPVLAQDDAPKPFKGLMAALQVGDEELAMKYAQQWATYLDDVKQRAGYVVSVTSAAQQSRETLPGDSPEFRKAREQMAAENVKGSGDEQELMEIMLDKSRKEHARANAAPPEQRREVKTEADEKAARAQIRAEMLKRVPKDPEGKVDIYVFFDPTDMERSKAFAPVAEEIRNHTKRDSRVNFVGLTTKKTSTIGLARFESELEVGFPFISGEAFASQLGLQSAPSVVLVLPNAGSVVRENGNKPFFYFDELIKVVQGANP